VLINLGLFNKKRETPEEKQSRLEHEANINRIYLKARRAEELLDAQRRGKADGLKGKTTVMTRLQASFEALPKSIKMVEDAIGEMPQVGPAFHEESTTKKATKRKNNKKEEPTKTLQEQVWEM